MVLKQCSLAEGGGAPQLEVRWMLSRLHAAAAMADPGLAAYEFSSTAQAIYAFWQYDVCDTFIELIKPIVRVRVSCYG